MKCHKCEYLETCDGVDCILDSQPVYPGRSRKYQDHYNETNKKKIKQNRATKRRDKESRY